MIQQTPVRQAQFRTASKTRPSRVRGVLKFSDVAALFGADVPASLVSVTSLDDPRVGAYANVRERDLAGAPDTSSSRGRSRCASCSYPLHGARLARAT
jgi:hypothetical protein